MATAAHAADVDRGALNLYVILTEIPKLQSDARTLRLPVDEALADIPQRRR